MFITCNFILGCRIPDGFIQTEQGLCCAKFADAFAITTSWQ